jgi:peptidoglycan/LPS O-acetylase OafA/YrhL
VSDAGVIQAGEVRSGRIESLRALAALSVLTWHALFLAPGAHGLVARGAYAGRYGVYLFFALSGFLLFLPFARHAFAHGQPIDLRRYAVNRALRILPLYYFVLAVLLLVGHGGGTLEQWVRFGTLTQSFFSDTVVNGVDGPMWSLAIELQFYVLLPLIAVGLAAVSRRSIRRAALVLAALALGSLGVWVAKSYNHHPPDFRWAYSLPVTFFHFVPGMLVALALVRLEQRQARWRPPGALCVLAGVACWAVASYEVSIAPPLVALASLLVVAGVALPLGGGGPVLRLLDARLLVAIGAVSYSLYLWHYPIVSYLGRHLDVSFWGLLGIGLLVCLPVAWLSYALVETPFLRLRRRWGSTAGARVGEEAGATARDAARSLPRAAASPRATASRVASRPTR